MDLGRIATAMVTPFDENGNINYEVAEGIIEYLIQNGTDTIVVCGTTGETPTLSIQEKRDFIDFTIKKVNKRIPVIAGVGVNDTAYTIEATKVVESFGADGIMVVAPFYNKPNQRGIYAHFEAISKVTNLPIVVYNVPGRTGVNIAAETTITLSKIPNIRIVKEACGNLDQMTEILANVSDDTFIYSGDDSLTLPLIAIGGRGVISVASHVVGNEMQAMIRAFEEGHHKKAAAIHQALLPLIKQLFANPNPVPVKYAMSKVGFNVEKVRLPLVELTDEDKAAFDQVWNTFQEKMKKLNINS
ncbi:4-hydroxy-tetrahydrodipicolinate synthase [Lysinibacillus endophyticus]|uniref:4-hydroxy-tetrahydrodipicolinate synthase n=1 Tax=Ureibacillus endophyticus TaxID=1978490 RepID=A0A494ZAX2_9BACL|nr:4-hydroxy-tetrahydrodipicolinate synthase [Lysinibacillus endophyticus]MCP1144104.1 4-hydroxy-tetrahydrodipicolinate synthase [Lysinibacillus endophyticus]RKQ19853.1 4-hydroxy-tetrahydrodipicolinate synthase [Lysinibacillus endophyticus]